MSQLGNLSRRWQNYRPSKTLWFWSVVASAVFVLILGFTVGGWMTQGGATTMADQAARNAEAKLAAQICVNKFVAAEDAPQKLAALKAASYWQRDDFIKNGGWATLAGMDQGVPGAVDLCADALLAMDKLPARKIEISPSSSSS